MDSDERKELRKKQKESGMENTVREPIQRPKKRKQRKACKKRKAKKGEGNKEKTLIADVQEIPETEPPAKKKRKEQTLNRPFSRGTYLVSLLKLHHQQKNQTEERNKATKKMQQKMLDSAGCGRMC